MLIRLASKFAHFLCLTVLLFAAFGSAQAQIVYPAKFVCGHQVGSIQLLSNHADPKGYEELKPGNYATVINVTNLSVGTETFEYFVSINLKTTGPLLVGPVAPTTMTMFGTAKIGCPDIAAALNLVLPASLDLEGEAFEGMVLIPKALNSLDVQAVYTYANMDQFASRLALYLGPGDVVQSAEIDDEISQEEANVFGASGAGGLGLGASIDVERIVARRTDFIASSLVTEALKPTPNK